MNDHGQIACPFGGALPNGTHVDGATWEDPWTAASSRPFHVVALLPTEFAKLRSILGDRWGEWWKLVDERTKGLHSKVNSDFA